MISSLVFGMKGSVCIWFGDHAETEPGDSAGQGASRSGTPDVRDPRAASGFSEASLRPWRVRCARGRTQPGQFSISAENLVAVDDGGLARVDGGNG